MASRTLNLKDHSIKAYNANRPVCHLAPYIRSLAGDRRPVNQEFFIVAEDNGYLVTDGQGIYKVAENGDILPTLVRLDIRDEQTTETFSRNFNDEPLADALGEIQRQHPNSLILVSGNITIDFPDELPSTIPETMRVYGSQLALTYADIKAVVPTLADQWIVGQLDFKVFTPAPTFSQ
ncbi:hypothetical protein FEK30_00815 (plasmid) [Picosynechococcus sp. PCC 11901]|uniref:hypothetical protein n=1 Tax=Picosynechococcus sp. PCC 11901 TaxID=2579791 RepID=UPI0010FC2C23|nr:hypothetical protein [Picosynechococcus sp. PCC 11901]QCS48097.1 hypothetical protein FEK30_00815 [Picosynechococcus sp. PCC 11901]